MTNTLADYFAKQGLKVIEASLRHVVGKPISYVGDDATYRMHVIQPGWSALPMPIRILMKRDFRVWEDLYQALKAETLDLSGNYIELRRDAVKAIARLVPSILGLPGAPPPPAVGVALPVKPRSGPIPMAAPVAGPPSAAAVVAAPAAAAPLSLEAAPAVGIDLGTTFSLVAHVDEHGRPRSLPNLEGERLTPSVVQFGDSGTIVGKQALQRSAFEPERTAICVKRDMGAKFYRQPINGESIPPEVISAFILRNLKEDAARELGPILRAVITVPAYFDETRRRATMDAGRLAGLDVLDIINEPTAAAIAYGYQTGFLDKAAKLVGDHPLRVLVFDLGGGTFDVTIVQIGVRVFKALATDGDVNLGGRDWDEKLVEIAAERFRSQHHFDPRENPIGEQELWIAAEGAKRTLSERPKATIHLNGPGGRLSIEVTRDEFEQATASLLERTRLTTEIVARQARLTFAELDRILLVGGSTRMPMVAAMLEKLTGKPVDRSISADEAVAHGAALYAKLLVKPAAPTDDSPEFVVTNVNSHSLGILGTDPKTGVKFNKVLIPKNTPLPCTVTRPFQTFRHGQRTILIKVLEGDSEKPALCTPVGVCTIGNLPPDLPAGWPIEVSYTYEANGQLRLKAKLKDHAAGITMDFLHEHTLPDEDVEVWANYVEEELSSALGDD